MMLTVVTPGIVDYPTALHMQEKLQSLRIGDQIGDTLLLLEHPPVITLGRRGQRANILASPRILAANQVKIFDVSRGGDVTYHGPGQIVGYPIMDLRNHGNDIKEFIWKIEEVFIKLLQEVYGITTSRDQKKFTGVWAGDQKITAIGIAVKKYVTMHGFAFNVNTDLEHFQWINPCGITDKGVVSLEKILGLKQDIHEVTALVIKYFGEVFNLNPQILETEDFYRLVEPQSDKYI